MPATSPHPPTGARRKIFQPLEKNFPIIGKTGLDFPTIGKKFSNHWKKTEQFFQSLENRRKIFPIVGKLPCAAWALLCGFLATAVPTALADMCPRLDIGVAKNGSELVVTFNGIDGVLEDLAPPVVLPPEKEGGTP